MRFYRVGCGERADTLSDEDDGGEEAHGEAAVVGAEEVGDDLRERVCVSIGGVAKILALLTPPVTLFPALAAAP